MRIVHVCDFHHFEEIRCDRCAMLRAMETGRVHVDAVIKKSDGEGVHLVAFAPYHIADMDYCSSNMDFAKRVWALQPNKRLVWQSCLQRLCQMSNDSDIYRALKGKFMMEYLWSDLSVVEEVVADTAVLPTVIVEKLAWMEGCRRAWLAARVKKFIERG